MRTNTEEQQKIAYPSCPVEKCKKKLQEMSDTWHCEKCCRDYARPLWRYSLGFTIADHTGSRFVRGFGDQVKVLLNNTEANDLVDGNGCLDTDKAEGQQLISACTNETFIMKLKAREEMYNDELRLSITVDKLRKVDFSSEARNLIDAIASHG